MDKIIEKTFYKSYRPWIILFAVIVFILLPFKYWVLDRLNIISVNKSDLTIYKVQPNAFENYIPITGNALPQKTIFLDIVSGGQVERVFVEDGDLVKAGDPIIQLANTTLLLDVMQREAQLFEQENQLRNTRLLFEQNTLLLEERLSTVEYNIIKAKRKYKQDSSLFEKAIISKSELQDSEDEYHYLLRQLNLTQLSIRKDSLFRIAQIIQLENSVRRLSENFSIVKETLEKLTVRAPVEGQINGMNIQIGETMSRGDRLGQIDVQSGFKIEAEIDEHYLKSIHKGLLAYSTISDQNMTLKIDKIYPRITNGQVKLDLLFVDEDPKLQVGQRIQLKLTLGKTSQSLQLKRGRFYDTTSGNWVYVIDNKSSTAKKRKIKLGLQNPMYYEIISGLDNGDEVIISSYDQFGNADQINIGD